MRVLFVCTHSPAPAHGGAALRIRGWLEQTAGFAEVGLVVLTRTAREDDAVRKLCATNDWWLATTLAERSAAVRLRDRALSLATARPHLLVASENRRFAATVHSSLQEFQPDIVQAEQLAAAPYLAAARSAGIKTVYAAHNVESRVVAAGPRSAAVRTERAERALAGQADALVTVSDEEADWFRGTAERVVSIPNAIQLERYPFRAPAGGDARRILFTGHLGYPPNRDAATLLAREIYPRVAARVEDARCLIAGSRPGRDMSVLARDGVEVRADFGSFEQLAASCALFACPLRSGAGSRLKLLEAAAVGLPIVATLFSAKGLRLEEGRDYRAATDPATFADAIVELFEDVDRRQSLSHAARSTVERHHDWAAQRERIAHLYEDLLGDAGQG